MKSVNFRMAENTLKKVKWQNYIFFTILQKGKTYINKMIPVERFVAVAGRVSAF
jgi:hypothetical protein